MATSGSQGRVNIQGTDGGDFSYRQTVESKYNNASQSKVQLKNAALFSLLVEVFSSGLYLSKISEFYFEIGGVIGVSLVILLCLYTSRIQSVSQGASTSFMTLCLLYIAVFVSIGATGKACYYAYTSGLDNVTADLVRFCLILLGFISLFSLFYLISICKVLHDAWNAMKKNSRK